MAQSYISSMSPMGKSQATPEQMKILIKTSRDFLLYREIGGSKKNYCQFYLLFLRIPKLPPGLT